MIEGLPPEIKRLYDKWEKDKSSKIFAALANGLRKMGFYDDALNIVKEGLLRNPDYPEGYLVLGRINLEKGDTQGAIEAFEKTVELDPYNAVAVRFLAECFESQGDTGKSLEYYKKLKDLDPFFEDIDKKIESMERRASIPDTHVEEISQLEEAPAEEPPLIPEEEKIFEFEESVKEEKKEEEVKEKPLLLDEFKTEEVPPFLAEEGEKVSILDELEKGPSEDTVTIEKEKEEKKEEIPELESAKIFEEQGFIAKALESYKKALEKYPENEELRTKVRELENKLKPVEKPEEKKIEEEPEIEEEEIVPPEIPEEAIKVFEEIEELPPVEEIFGEEKLKPEKTPPVEEMVEDEGIKYSPHPFKIEEQEKKEDKEKVEEVPEVLEEKEEKSVLPSIEEETSEDIFKIFTEEETAAPVLPEEEKPLETPEDMVKEEKEEEPERVEEEKKEFVPTSAVGMEEESVDTSVEELMAEETFEPVPDETALYKPFYEIEAEIGKPEPEKITEETVQEEPLSRKDELEALLQKMHEEKRKEESVKREMEEKIKEEEKIKDEENYRTFLEWIEKLKK